jgi:hypothetical protein
LEDISKNNSSVALLSEDEDGNKDKQAKTNVEWETVHGNSDNDPAIQEMLI